jgi:sulfatase modifying factor 1
MNPLIQLIQVFLVFWCPADMAPAGLACVDRYEAPNIEGAKPMVMQSALDAIAWCEARGKRLCSEREWDLACFESGSTCNNDKMWKPWDRKTANSASEVARLWQGTPSGAYKGCRTPWGVYDLKGNVEEWAVSSEGRDWPYTLKGGWWAKTTACYKSNDAHEPEFRFYETGFRCCLTPW